MNKSLRELVFSREELPPRLCTDFQVTIGIAPVQSEVKHHILAWARTYLEDSQRVDAYLWRIIFGFAGTAIQREIQFKAVRSSTE